MPPLVNTWSKSRESWRTSAAIVSSTSADDDDTLERGTFVAQHPRQTVGIRLADLSGKDLGTDDESGRL